MYKVLRELKVIIKVTTTTYRTRRDGCGEHVVPTVGWLAGDGMGRSAAASRVIAYKLPNAKEVNMNIINHSAGRGPRAEGRTLIRRPAGRSPY